MDGYGPKVPLSVTIPIGLMFLIMLLGSEHSRRELDADNRAMRDQLYREVPALQARIDSLREGIQNSEERLENEKLNMVSPPTEWTTWLDDDKDNRRAVGGPGPEPGPCLYKDSDISSDRKGGCPNIESRREVAKPAVP